MAWGAYPYYLKQVLPFGIPPEIFLQIFHWATLDDNLLSCRPSWKNWDLENSSGLEPHDPWPKLNQEALTTSKSLSLVCRAFRSLSHEFIFRHIVLSQPEDLNSILLTLSPEMLKWVRRLSLSSYKEGIWSSQDTSNLIVLVQRCPNLEVCSNSTATFGEDHDAGPLLLEALMQNCSGLRRLHWNPTSCMTLDSAQWTRLLSGATNLEALEILGPEPQCRSFSSTPIELELPSLHSLRLCANEDFASFLSAIAGQWTLPKLTHLDLKTTQHPSRIAIESLVAAHGSNLTSIYLDENTCYDIDVRGVVQAAGSLRDLCIHDIGILQGDGLPGVVNLILVALEPTLDDPLGATNLAGYALQLGSRFPQEFQALKRVVLVNPEFPANGVMAGSSQMRIPNGWHAAGLRALHRMVKRGIQVTNWQGAPVTFESDG